MSWLTRSKNFSAPAPAKAGVEVHHDAVSRRNKFLRALHRLMRRASRPEAEALLGEIRVPLALQHLQHRLLDKAVEHRWNAKQPWAARHLRYLFAQHRLRPVAAIEKVDPDRGPMVFQVGHQIVNGHAVHAGCALVAPDLCQRLRQIVSLDNRFHRRSGPDRLAFEGGFRRAGFGPCRIEPRGFTLRRLWEGQFEVDFLPHVPREVPVLLAVPSFGPSPEMPGYYARC